jgi:hypothetical protein
MPDDTISAIAKLVDLPDGAVPTTAVAVIGYIDSDGTGRYGIAANEGADCHSIVGFLGMASHQFIHEISYDEDD